MTADLRFWANLCTNLKLHPEKLHTLFSGYVKGASKGQDFYIRQVLA
jgi:hypothetical protein